MKVFITGGTGFIGSHVINTLIERGHSVLALKRCAQSSPRIPLHSQPKWIVSSLTEIQSDCLEDVDVLLHLAAHSANYPYDTLENCLHWNVTAPLNLLTAAFNANVSKYLIAGSCFEYGLSAQNYDFIPACAPLLPVQTYPTSKAAASVSFTQWAYQRKISMSLLRFFQVYGPGEEPTRLWPTLIRAGNSGLDVPMTLGEQVRDFIFVQDLATRIVDETEQLCEQKHSIKIANIGSGTPQSLRSFAQEIWNKVDSSGQLRFGEIPYRPDEVMRYVPDLSPFYLTK